MGRIGLTELIIMGSIVMMGVGSLAVTLYFVFRKREPPS
jgi:hypothetical protein